jgi:hypothetical protein
MLDSIVEQCIQVGILTKDKVKKYPLQNGNLAVVLKIYAMYVRLPFVFNYKQLKEYKNYKLYLTDTGYSWVINEFKKYTLLYLRSAFPHLFANLNNLDNIDTYKSLNNFKGITGVNYLAGTKGGALLIRRQGTHTFEETFDTLLEARKEILNLSRFFSIENFVLYRTGYRNGVYYKNKIPLILESNRRGVPVNLPHLKGKV